jgi:exodeoxyribonuclease VII large subunit
MTKRLNRARERLTAMAQCRVLCQPLERVRTLQQALDEWSARLQRAACLHVERQRQRMAQAAGRLHSLSPLNVLQRGYSLTVLESTETLLRSASQAQTGDRIVTRLASGRLVSRVEETDSNPAS